jgi:hypothetical protein
MVRLCDISPVSRVSLFVYNLCKPFQVFSSIFFNVNTPWNENLVVKNAVFFYPLKNNFI